MWEPCLLKDSCSHFLLKIKYSDAFTDSGSLSLNPPGRKRSLDMSWVSLNQVMFQIKWHFDSCNFKLAKFWFNKIVGSLSSIIVLTNPNSSIDRRNVENLMVLIDLFHSCKESQFSYQHTSNSRYDNIIYSQNQDTPAGKKTEKKEEEQKSFLFPHNFISQIARLH